MLTESFSCLWVANTQATCNNEPPRPLEEVPDTLCHPPSVDLSNATWLLNELINQIAVNANGSHGSKATIKYCDKDSATIDEKRTTRPQHGVWDGHNWWWRYVSIHFPTWPHTQHGHQHQVPGTGSAELDFRRRLLEDPMSCNRTLYYAIRVGEPSVGCQKNSAITLPLISGCLSLLIAIPLIYSRRVRLSERQTKLCATWSPTSSARKR